MYFFYFLFFVVQEAQYGQGYGQQGAPTSFSNQMWADRKKVRLWRLSECLLAAFKLKVQFEASLLVCWAL